MSHYQIELLAATDSPLREEGEKMKLQEIKVNNEGSEMRK